MDTREAFNAVQEKVKADPRKDFVDAFYDEQVFGNFWIIYDEGGERLSVVNDRGQLILYEGRTGDHFRALLLNDLPSADEKAVLQAVT